MTIKSRRRFNGETGGGGGRREANRYGNICSPFDWLHPFGLQSALSCFIALISLPPFKYSAPFRLFRPSPKDSGRDTVRCARGYRPKRLERGSARSGRRPPEAWTRAPLGGRAGGRPQRCWAPIPTAIIAINESYHRRIITSLY